MGKRKREQSPAAGILDFKVNIKCSQAGLDTLVKSIYRKEARIQTCHLSEILHLADFLQVFGFIQEWPQSTRSQLLSCIACDTSYVPSNSRVRDLLHNHIARIRNGLMFSLSAVEYCFKALILPMPSIFCRLNGC